MKEIKLYMKFLCQYNCNAILIVMGILSFVPFFMAGLVYIINLIAGNTQAIGEIYFAMDNVVVGFMLCCGIGAIVKGYEIAMRIRADRKSFIIALGIMSVIASVTIGVWKMILNPLVHITYKKLFEAESGVIVFIKSIDLLENISLSLCILMMGILIGCIYNRLGAGRFVAFIITVIALLIISLWTLVFYNEKLVLQVMELFIEGRNSVFYLVISMIVFLISWCLLIKSSFGNYSSSEGLVRKGKAGIGNIRIGKF